MFELILIIIGISAIVWVIQLIGKFFGFLGDNIETVLTIVFAIVTIYSIYQLIKFLVRAAEDRDVGVAGRTSVWLMALILVVPVATAAYALIFFPEESEPAQIGTLLLAGGPSVCAALFRILKAVLPFSAKSDSLAHCIAAIAMTVIFAVVVVFATLEINSGKETIVIVKDCLLRYALFVFFIPGLIFHLGWDYYSWF